MIVAEKDKTKEMFEKNLNLLTPWLRKSVLDIDKKELWDKIKIHYNDEGYPVCQYKKDDKTFHITSEHPNKEVKRWKESITERGKGAIFLFGCGFGYPLFELFKEKMSHTLVIVFEEDLYIFAAMLHYFDMEPLINTHKIVFLIGDTKYFNKAFNELFFSIFFINCTYPTIAFTYSSLRNFKKEYLKIYDYVFSQLSLMVFYVGNDHQDNLIGFCNLLSNTKEVIKSPYLSCLKDKYKDVPAFIIANGPSLDKNINLLHKIEGKGLILSVESAILPLLKNNIKPDMLTVIERTKNTYKYHFKDMNYSDDIALFSLGVVDKHVLPSFSGMKIPVFRNKEVINKWMNYYIGDGIGIDAGANVSHFAVELATYFGANPIVFVGQDYAYGEDRVTHSKNSIYSEEKGKELRKIIEDRPIIDVEGNNGKMIASNQLWIDFRMGLEQKIKDHGDKLFLNATQGGAKIEGTKCKKLKDVINEYCKKEIPCRVNEIICENKKTISVSKRKDSLEEFITSIQKYANLFRDLTYETIIGKLECQEMIQLCHKKDSNKYHDELEKAYKKNLEIFNHFMSDGMYRSFSQQVIFADFHMINSIGAINTQEKIEEIFKIQYNFFCHLNVVTQSVSVHFENAVKSLTEVLEDLKHNKEEV